MLHVLVNCFPWQQPFWIFLSVAVLLKHKLALVNNYSMTIHVEIISHYFIYLIDTTYMYINFIQDCVIIENKSFLNIFLKKLYAKLYLMATVLYANFCRESNVIRSNPMVAVLPHYNSRSYTIIFTSLKKKFSVNQKVTQNVNIHVYSKFAINPFLIIKPFK